MDKARRELGYSPKHYDLASCGAVDWFLERGWAATPRATSRAPGGHHRLALSLLLVALLAVLAFAWSK